MVVPAAIVVDTSFTMRWIFRDEATELSDRLWKALVKGTVTAHVPGLWPMEVVNVTLRGPRKDKLQPSEDDVAAFLAIVRKMPLRVHFQGLESLLDQAVPLMRKHRMTCYDASYLMLAKRAGLTLATGDTKMLDVAKLEGVKVLK